MDIKTDCVQRFLHLLVKDERDSLLEIIQHSHVKPLSSCRMVRVGQGGSSLSATQHIPAVEKAYIPMDAECWHDDCGPAHLVMFGMPTISEGAVRRCDDDMTDAGGCTITTVL
jgi:hypothetical protein